MKYPVLAALLLVPVLMFSQEPAVIPVSGVEQATFTLDGKTVTLSEYIMLLLEKNSDSLAASYALGMTDTDYQKFQKKYAFYLNGEASATKAKYPDVLASETGTGRTEIKAQASVMKMFSTGTTVTAGYSHEYGDVTGFSTGSDTIDFDYHKPVVFASIQQELLKNSFGTNDRSTEKILENVAIINRLSAESQLSGVVLQGIVNYWTYVIAKSDYENSRMKLDETIRVRNIVRGNVGLGLAEQFDLNYYNALVAGSEAAAQMSEQEYRDAARAILRSLNLTGDETRFGAVNLYDGAPSANEEAYLALALKQRADYAAAKLGYENARLQAGIYDNTDSPSLVASLSANTLGYGDNSSKAVSNAATAKYPSVTAGIALSYPLGDTEQAVNLRDSRYKVEQARISYEKTERELRDEIKSRVEFATRAHAVLKSAERARTETETYYNLLLANLRRGRFNSVTVKQALDARADSRQSALQARVQYNVALLRLELAANNLFTRFGITVKVPEIK